MPIQDFNIYTANGYEGDLVDSGPRVVQTGVLTSANAGFGKALSRDSSVERGVALGSAEIEDTSTTNVFALTQREYNHEAGTRPSTGNDTKYLITESVSIIRQGFLYLKVRDHAVTAGEALVVEEATGVMVGGAAAAGTVAGESVALNIFAEEAGIAGDIIKARIDIVS
jgi:hypothetical protein